MVKAQLYALKLFSFNKMLKGKKGKNIEIKRKKGKRKVKEKTLKLSKKKNTANHKTHINMTRLKLISLVYMLKSLLN